MKTLERPKTGSECNSAVGAATLALATWIGLSLPGCGTHEVESIDNVSSFTAQEDPFTLGTDLTLTAGDKSLGSVQQYRVAVRESYAFYDAHGNHTATAIKRMLSIGVCIDIYDSKNQKIGTVSEKTLTNLLSPLKTYYEITDADGAVVGESSKSDFLGTEITINSPKGDTLAVLSRSFFDTGNDTWSINVPGPIDRRLIVFIPSFKTHADAAREE